MRNVLVLLGAVTWTPVEGHPGPRRPLLHPENMAPNSGTPRPRAHVCERFPFELALRRPPPSSSSSTTDDGDDVDPFTEGGGPRREGPRKAGAGMQVDCV